MWVWGQPKTWASSQFSTYRVGWVIKDARQAADLR
ncbi:hypothetical protein SAJA_04980 [Salinisphaera japonica YTM-1]|uniref:Uncharacterized protein n=1 Tax=Salinisphaera japonica YTM-1 TaxID=1209778 RepID=A0A423PWY8_9GAMM|nr:hypothetical protein SAJA_04980 [Salinisphaera japonica YTM-1]